jgi:hypothetical protein
VLVLSIAFGLPGRAAATTCLLPIHDGAATGDIRSLAPDGADVLIAASRGVFRASPEGLVSLKTESGVDLTSAYAFSRNGDDLLVAAIGGLFRLTGNRLVRLGDVTVTGADGTFRKDGGDLLIATTTGVVRLDNGRPLALKGTTGLAYGFYRDGEDLLVATQAGLFRRAGDQLIRLEGSTGEVGPMLKDGPDLLVGGDGGLFRRQGQSLVKLGGEPGKVLSLIKDGKDVLVGGANGLFRRAGDGVVRLDDDTGRVTAFYGPAPTLLIQAQSSQFIRNEGRLVRLPAVMGSIRAVRRAGPELLVGAENGLFLLVNERPVEVKPSPGKVSWFEQVGSDLLVGANGLFRVIDHLWSEVRVSTRGVLDLNVPPPPTVIEWKIPHPCAPSAALEDFALSGIPPSASFRPLGKTDAGHTLQAEVRFPDRKETYRTTLLAREAGGRQVSLAGSEVTVRVGWTAADYAKHYGSIIGNVLLAGHTIVFVALLIGARRSAACWRVLTDPVWGRLGLWFYFALRHVRPLQRWVMMRWFAKMREAAESRPYLPVTLMQEGQPACMSDGLIEALAKIERLWIQGNAGMGKTELVSFLKARFFNDANLPTLERAYRRYGFIPVIVTLHDYAKAQRQAGPPGAWIATVARLEMSARGFPVENAALFRAMLGSGQFRLVLDGANEVPFEDEVEMFARSPPQVNMLVTSQAAGSRYFTNWHLPPVIGTDLRRLLELYLDGATGTTAFERVSQSSLIDDIRSGYDVRLIAHAIERKGLRADLPRDRLGLYELMLEDVWGSDGPGHADEQLCRVAWGLWRDGERRFSAEGHFDADLMARLYEAENRILRRVEGTRYEFRHDQMRAYLAARWAARHETHPQRLFAEETTIWRLSRRDQEEVWGFFARMIGAEPEKAILLWQWSIEDQERAVLQWSLQGELRKAGYGPTITLH